MALILCIETSTKACSVALFEDGNLLANKELITGQFTHAENLHLFAGEVMKITGKTFGHLSAIAVSGGPGSYTGLRIGVSAAKGWCYSLDIPLITVNTLLLVAIAARDRLVNEKAVFLPLLDARRMEVFCAAYNKNLEEIWAPHPEIITEKSFEDLLKENKVVFCGNGAEKCKPVFEKHPNALFAEMMNPLARYMGEVSFKKFKEQAFEDLAYFGPSYLKEFYSTQNPA